MSDRTKDNPYLRQVVVTNGPDAGKTFVVDIYDVVSAFKLTNVGQIQAVKKLLRGGRTDKDLIRDLEEAVASATRAIQIEKGLPCQKESKSSTTDTFASSKHGEAVTQESQKQV